MRKKNVRLDFSRAGKLAGKFFDRDKMSIGRRMVVVLPDGREEETGPEKPLYTNVKCHIVITSADNPNPTNVVSNPVVKALTINCDVKEDLRNGDFITAYKLDEKGDVLAVYQGIIGEPSFSEGRQDVTMAVDKQ